MSRAYIRISTKLLEELLRLPEGVHIETCFSFPGGGNVTLIVSGSGIPESKWAIHEAIPVYETITDGDHRDHRFVKWRERPG